MTTKTKTCKERIAKEFSDTMKNLKERLAQYYKGGNEDGDCPIFNWGLSFDYVAPETFRCQRRGYWRFQICWGGPSEEIRFFASQGYRGWELDYVEYWFMDWFDGAKKTLKAGANFEACKNLWEIYEGADLIESSLRKALEE